MTLQSYVAKAYMLSYIQQKSVEFYYVLQATSKTAPTDLNRKNVFFQKWNGGFIQLGKMVSIDKISASNSKFENLRWTPYFKKHVNIFFKRIFFVAEQFLALHRYLFSYLLISYLLIFVVSSRLPIYTTRNNKDNAPCFPVDTRPLY